MHPATVYRFVFPALLLTSLSCTLLLSDDPETSNPPPTTPTFDGCRIKVNDNDVAVTDVYLLLEQNGGMLNGCMAVDRPVRGEVDYLPFTGRTTGDGTTGTISVGVREGEGATREQVELTMLAESDGAIDPDFPRVSIASTLPRYDVGELIQSDCTCEDLQTRFEGENRVASLGAAVAVRPINLDALLSEQQVVADHRPAAPEPRDDRFAGRYCQLGTQKVCRSGRVGFGPFAVSREVCVDLARAEVTLGYFEGRSSGKLHGHGTFLLDGQLVQFATAGAVSGPGRASLRLQLASDLAQFDNMSDNARLLVSNDPRGVDHRLRLDAFNETLVLGKQACDNRPPTVALSAPDSPLRWGELHCFVGTVTADEDAEFALSSLNFAGSGADEANVETTGPRSARWCTSALPPGEQTITFNVRDSGGLPGRASATVTVRNLPPRQPRIVKPTAADLLVAGGPVALRGTSIDPEEGALSGGQLRWSVVDPNGNTMFLGVGRRLSHTFASPGEWTLRLQATDAAGGSASAERTVSVQASTGNTPPQVTIEIPDALTQAGPIAGAFEPGDILFRGTVSDAEQSAASLTLTWTATPLQPSGPALTPVTGSTLASFPLTVTAGGRTLYEVRFTAVDSGGLTGQATVRVVIWPDLP